MLTNLETRGAATWITLDDGRVNAMSEAMLTEISGRLLEARGPGRPVVIEGRPGIFSAGFDLKTLRSGEEPTLRMIDAGIALIVDLLAYELPVLTLCTGHAYPVGAFIMMAADVRFGFDGDWRIGLNEVAIGLAVPDFAIALARHRLHPSAVARLTTGAMFAPAEALRHGYLDYVGSEADMRAAIAAEAARLASLDPAIFAATKARINAPVIAAMKASKALIWP